MTAKADIRVGIVGATGLVGQVIWPNAIFR